MKVEQKPAVFSPVTITLESELEVKYLLFVLRHVGGVGECRKFTDSLCDILGSLGIRSHIPSRHAGSINSDLFGK